MKVNNQCKWAVAYKTDGSFYDDGQERITIIALFRYPLEAEDFIDNCLPKENRHRFFVEHIDRM